VIEGHDLELFDRSLRSATEQHTGDALDAALHDLGWSDALPFDTRAAVSCLFEAQGASGSTSSALDVVLTFGLGRALDDTTAVLLPPISEWGPPARIEGGRLVVDGLVAARRPSVLVVAGAGASHVATVVEAAALESRDVQGMDPWLGLLALRGEVEVAGGDEAPTWDDAVALGRLAVAHELVGASCTALALAREHALERVQFGQPIAMFQAVRHKLAEALVAIETTRAVLDAVWQDRSPQTAAMAKATAGRSARTVSRHCQQVLAGIGFTTEHELHRYVRRILVLEQLFGSHAVLTTHLGDELVTTRTLPRLVPL
jgi:hypothetical protein